MGSVCAARLNTVRKEPQMTVLSERIRAHVRVGAGVAIIANFYVCKNVIGLCGAACVCVWGGSGGKRVFAPFGIRDIYHLGWQSVIGSTGQRWVGEGVECVYVGEGQGAVEWGHAEGL